MKIRKHIRLFYLNDKLKTENAGLEHQGISRGLGTPIIILAHEF